MKRFYQQAQVAEDGDGFVVTLDGRPVMTPAGARIQLSTRALAEAVAAEWEAQEDEVVPGAMPLTRLAATAIDRVAPGRARVIDEIAAYGASDLLCYRAERPPELVDRQAEAWQTLLDKVAERFGARLETTRGVAPVEQPGPALAALRAALETRDEMALAALHSATAATGSAVIALLLAAGEIDGERAWSAADLDETFQAETWGKDDEGEAARAARRGDLFAAARFLTLILGIR